VTTHGDASTPPKSNPASSPSAPLLRRALSLFYEALLLAALLMIGALPFVLLTHDADRIVVRPLFQIYLTGLAASYFGWQWLHGGQTLPMKTWRLKLVTREDGPLTLSHAARRLLFACAGVLALGVAFLWVFIDPDRLFLHDRLAGTRIVSSEQ
jgi:uncharacterized RDD family membrane protein YckC